MKKFVSLVLTLALAACMCVTAFAADPTKDVTATYNADSATKISYTYGWGDPHFTYNAGNQVWNPETHAYEAGNGAATWSAEDNEIKITNHSNAAINVRFSYAAAEGYEAAKIGFTKNNFEIPTAEGTTVDAAPSETVQCGPTEDATLPEGTNNAVIGTITIHVTAA